jgi:hypothetical protein
MIMVNSKSKEENLPADLQTDPTVVAIAEHIEEENVVTNPLQIIICYTKKQEKEPKVWVYYLFGAPTVLMIHHMDAAQHCI